MSGALEVSTRPWVSRVSITATSNVPRSMVTVPSFATGLSPEASSVFTSCSWAERFASSHAGRNSGPSTTRTTARRTVGGGSSGSRASTSASSRSSTASCTVESSASGPTAST